MSRMNIERNERARENVYESYLRHRVFLPVEVGDLEAGIGELGVHMVKPLGCLAITEISGLGSVNDEKRNKYDERANCIGVINGYYIELPIGESVVETNVHCEG